MTPGGKYDARRGVWIAPADTLKGQLQRGRGAGFLAALEVPGEQLWPILLEIIANDPRWDPQVERSGEMYAELMIASRMDLAPVEALVRAHGTSDRSMSEFLPFQVVVELAKRGEKRSFALLRDRVRNAEDWSSAFDALEEIGTQEALEDLDEILLSRVADADELEQHLPWDEDRGSWPTWRVRHPRIDEGMRARKAAMARESAEAAKLEGLSIEELLMSPVRDHGNPRAGNFVWGKIAALVRPSDLPVVIRHLDCADIRVCRRALGALRKISSPEAFSALRTFIDSNPIKGERCMGYVARALDAQPPALGLELGRAWFEHADWPFSAWGQNLLSEHATVDDLPLLERALSQCWDDPSKSYRACSVLEAFGRLPGAGRFPDMERAFVEAHYSWVRQEAAHAMHVTDPQTFADRFAFECLWDCRPGTRELGVAAVDLSVPKARERVAALAADEHEDIRPAARKRLGA